MSRRLKQLLYGLFYLLLWLVVGSLIYFLFLKPAPSCFDNIQNQGETGVDCGGPCQKVCVPQNIKPVEIAEDVKIFYPLPGSIGLLAKIQNPNPDYAVKNLDYVFQLFDYQNNLLRAVDGSSFIYAGEIKYLAVPNLSFVNSQNIGRVELVIKNSQWVRDDAFKAPVLSVQIQNAAVKNNLLQVNGRISNNDTVAFAKTLIVAVFYGQSGQIDGVSQSELDNLVPGEVKTFTVSHPLVAGVDLNKTQFFVYARRP